MPHLFRWLEWQSIVLKLLGSWIWCLVWEVSALAINWTLVTLTDDSLPNYCLNDCRDIFSCLQGSVPFPSDHRHFFRDVITRRSKSQSSCQAPIDNLHDIQPVASIFKVCLFYWYHNWSIACPQNVSRTNEIVSWERLWRGCTQVPDHWDGEKWGVRSVSVQRLLLLQLARLRWRTSQRPGSKHPTQVL